MADPTATRAMTLAGLGSAALLAGAFAFQYLGELHPCQLCLWQRWPHAAAVLILGLALASGQRGLAWAGALAAVTAAGLGLFHAGVEQGWWEFISTCTTGSLGGLSGADLLNVEIATAPPVRCDAIAWSFLGLSMAAWNAVISTLLALIWVYAATRPAGAGRG